MPTYQYRCADCGTDLEVVQKFSDAPLTECPTCGGSLRKVYNAVGVVFKGSGFYKTDSRSSGTAKTASTSTSAAGESSSSSSDSSTASTTPASKDSNSSSGSPAPASTSSPSAASSNSSK